MLRDDRLLLSRRKGLEHKLLLLFMISGCGFLLGNLVINLFISLTLVILFWLFWGLLHRVASEIY